MRWILALQEYRFTPVHRKGAANPADVPSREPQACMADGTGARLDGQQTDWPLPAVLRADLSPDDTLYSHDQLEQLRMRAVGESEEQLMTAAAAALAAETVRPVSMPQLQFQVLHCLVAHAALASTVLVLVLHVACFMFLRLSLGRVIGCWVAACLSDLPSLAHFSSAPPVICPLIVPAY
jgi:hypothetical protein